MKVELMLQKLKAGRYWQLGMIATGASVAFQSFWHAHVKECRFSFVHLCCNWADIWHIVTLFASFLTWVS
jgi:hypothetical protein